MTILPVLLALAAAYPPGDPDPSPLIVRLGSNRAAERDEATEALARMGRPVLPALQKAAAESRDQEVRDRAGRLVKRIEHEVLTSPTLVTLDVRDRTVAEAVEDLLGMKAVIGDASREVKGRLSQKITLREAAPVPLLTALDKVCAAGGLRFAYWSINGDPTPDLADMTPPKLMHFALRGRTAPVSEIGPFRVKVTGTTYSLTRWQTFDVAAGQNERSSQEQSSLQMELMAEPRLRLKRGEGPKVLEMVDDLGASLIVERALYLPSAFGDSVGPSIAFQVAVESRPRAGGTIKRLRGSLPIEVAEFSRDAMTIPLAGSAGKTFDGTDATIAIRSINPGSATESPSISLTVRSKFADLDPSAVRAEPPPAQPGFPPPPEFLPFLYHQFQLVDETGRTLVCSAQTERKSPREANLTFWSSAVGVGPDAIRPAKLVYRGIIRTRFDVPFEFHDVPLP